MPKVIDLPTVTSMDGADYLIMEESGGGTKKITKSNATDKFNYKYFKSDIANTTTVSTTETEVARMDSHTFRAGSYAAWINFTHVKLTSASYAGVMSVYIGNTKYSEIANITHVGGANGLEGSMTLIAMFTLSTSVTGALNLRLRTNDSRKSFVFEPYTDVQIAGIQIG